jgi:chorismate mutase
MADSSSVKYAGASSRPTNDRGPSLTAVHRRTWRYGVAADPQEAKVESVEAGRSQIDELDTAICELVDRRRGVSQQIQGLRRAAGRPRIEYTRENQFIARYSDALGRPGVTIAMAVLEHCRGDRKG